MAVVKAIGRMRCWSWFRMDWYDWAGYCAVTAYIAYGLWAIFATAFPEQRDDLSYWFWGKLIRYKSNRDEGENNGK